MLSNSSDGNIEKSGYVIDVLDELSKEEKFDYELTLSTAFGSADAKLGTWTGMIGDVMTGKVDMAFADITMTPGRLEVVDFSYPFQSFKLSVLTHKPDNFDRTGSPMSIFSPFSMDVWLYMIIMSLVYVVVMFFIGRISVKDWRLVSGDQNKNPKNEFGLWNTFWFTTSSLFLKTVHATPRGVAVRVLSICFYFFITIMTFLYIAGLTSYILSGSASSSHSIENLLKERKEFGAIRGGSTHFFLKNSENALHQSIHVNIAEKDLYASNKEAVQHLELNPNLALVVESPFMELTTSRKCHLHGIKFNDSPRYHGIVLPLHSPHKPLLSRGLLKLQFSGRLEALYRKWWKVGGRCKMPNREGSEGRVQITIANIRNLCMFLGVAVVACVVLAVVEFVARAVYMNQQGKRGLVNYMRSKLSHMCTCRDRIPATHLGDEEHEEINVDAI